MNCVLTSDMNIMEFMDADTFRISVWVYDSKDYIEVFEQDTPNCAEVWFEFHKFSNFYWRMLEDECIDEIKGSSFYNFCRIKKFMIRRMLCGTNISWIKLSRSTNGALDDESYNSVMRVHPRILRVVMDKMDIFPKQLEKKEEKELEKQCIILFGKGDGVMNPHPYIVSYCNLISFWDKFGMNYFDIMKLPRDMFAMLKKMMNLESHNKSMKNIDSPNHGSKPSMRF